jgi:hypothetical protein
MVKKNLHIKLNSGISLHFNGLKWLVVLFILIGSCKVSFGQGVCIDSTAAAPNASAILDLTSTTRGLLIPRMTTVQMNAIASPDTSLMIFNTDNSCIYYYTGPPLSAWQTMYCSCTSAPATPGTITGTQFVCANSTLTYSIAAVANATSYVWTGPSGSVVASGQGTTSISIILGSAAGNISVVASNSCGTSASDTLALTVNPNHGTAQYNFENGVQTWTVPPCVTLVTLSLYGAQGGEAGYDNEPFTDNGGEGGTVTGTLIVTSGTVLNIYTGGEGSNGVMAEPGDGGYNGGGNAFYIHSSYSGGGGGGATDIRIGGTALTNRIVVAGGGGGAGCSHTGSNYDRGGNGGTATGGDGYDNNVLGGGTSGDGGTAAAGGAGGSGACVAGSGTLGNGGNACATAKNAGGGGGGGYYGGGAGYNCGGGGGSSYTGGLTSVITNTAGTNTGNGSVTIQW